MSQELKATYDETKIDILWKIDPEISMLWEDIAQGQNPLINGVNNSVFAIKPNVLETEKEYVVTVYLIHKVTKKVLW